LVYSILLNIPIINYHPMNLLPASSTLNSNPNIADLFTKPLPRHRLDTLIGDTTTPPPSTSVASTLVASTTAVDSLATVVASAPTTTLASDSVPFNPNLDAPLPVIDTGAPHSITSFASEFTLEVSPASYGLIRSSTSVVSDSKSYSAFASTPVDPYTLITGEDTIDLSDSDSVDTVEFASTLVYSSFRQFGTATLVFLSDANSKLITILVEPTQVDWIHWVPLPRLTPTESYFHICGRDYLQAFALFHLIPIWIALVFALLRSD